MSPPLEHDYIGLSELPSPASAAAAAGGAGRGGEGRDELKKTELRLGPPGSESPDRGGAVGLTLELLPKGFAAAGAKRGFSDTIDGSGKWIFSGGAGSEAEMGKGGVLFSPRGEAVGRGPHLGHGGGGKEAMVKAVAPEKMTSPPESGGADRGIAPAAKAQVVGWPPIRSYRKNTMATNQLKNKEDAESKQAPGCLYVKVSMDGAPYLRKVDLKMYMNYKELSVALEKMFSGFTIGPCGSQGTAGKDSLSESRMKDLLNGTEYVLTYEDKDGDLMLVGDVPWQMFTDSCRRLRIMKGSDAIGLAPRAVEKCKSRN